jgi:sugar (pentulose or hexulose) kinase
MILALDLGSTSFKAAVVDERLRVRGFGAVAVAHEFSEGGKVEIPVVVATDALRRAIRSALAASGIRATRLHAVAVTSQAQTFTSADKSGRARMPFISWQDNRAVAACDALKKLEGMREIGSHCSFGSFVPALQLCQLRHLQMSRPKCFTPTDLVLHLPTYFVRQWTNVAIIDENLAAMSGLYSLVMRDWWPAALRSCGLSPSQLPTVRPVGAVAASTTDRAEKFGLPARLPVVLAGNDQTAGAYAARLDENRGLLVTLGTAQAAYVRTVTLPRPHPSLFRGPFPGGGFYRMAADGCGGSIINWAKTILAGCETDRKFFALAAMSPPGSNGAVFNPGGNDEGASWRNLAAHHTTADLARAVLEGLTQRTVALVKQVAPDWKGGKIFVAGGGSENPLWVRMLSEKLGAKCHVTEANPCLGAARMALRTVLKIRV